MINSIDEYLDSLKKELEGCDSATIQDALSDAEEHLRTAIDKGLEESNKVVEADVLSNVIEKYGTPNEIANAYRDIEYRIRPAFARTQVSSNKSLIARFFGIFADARAWGSLIYIFFALVTGIIYFTWTVSGISIGMFMIFLIIGIPIIILFLYSVRGIAFVEGRIVEALLGERMPRRARFTDKNVKLWDRIKNLLTDRSTWTGILYLILQLPIGVTYFTILITLITVSLTSIFVPIMPLLWNIPVDKIVNEIVNEIEWIEYGTFYWLLPLIVLAGFLLLTITMHLAKFVGKIHGKYAKALLVSE